MLAENVKYSMDKPDTIAVEQAKELGIVKRIQREFLHMPSDISHHLIVYLGTLDCKP